MGKRKKRDKRNRENHRNRKVKKKEKRKERSLRGDIKDSQVYLSVSVQQQTGYNVGGHDR